ncbi:nucleotidyltransferase family protein [Deinococcus pimensis]|uniref:nucleotidyltransferase family protein n=1 Tax=Deinococcus pimensis TaxID=309888 RepID=UPI000489869D|nr:nucleotidyltransferase family protein [Deinococcus pimensis]
MNAHLFLQQINHNGFNRVILERLPRLNLPQAHLVAGCLFQTIWNVQAGLAPHHGIMDYDVFYFDEHDVSYEAEDHAIRRAAALFADLPVRVELRNQARVHLWYEQRFGRPCPQLSSTRAGIDRFLILATCVGITSGPGGAHEVYAPHGFSDLVGGMLRPNPVHGDRALFEAKARSYQERWPWLHLCGVKAG